MLCINKNDNERLKLLKQIVEYERTRREKKNRRNVRQNDDDNGKKTFVLETYKFKLLEHQFASSHILPIAIYFTNL